VFYSRVVDQPRVYRLNTSLRILRSLSRASRSRFSAGSRRAVTIVAAVAVMVGAPTRAAAQRADSMPRLGLGASSALSVYGGVGQFKYGSLGRNVGAALDLGWIGSRHLRVSVGVDYLTTTITRTDSLGFRARGTGYVFSGLADLSLMGPIRRRFTPYAGIGFGVDAVGTQISNEQVGALYNTNVFEVHGQLGTLMRLTPRGRVHVEARAIGARVVRRYSVRVGYTWLFNGLREEDYP
jgi:hypothetical protein